MTLQPVAAVVPIGVAAILSLFLAVFAWLRRPGPLGAAFAVMMAGETLWALGSALEPVVVELPVKRFFLDVRLLGTAVAILGLLAFVFHFTGISRWAQPRRFLLFCLPAVPILLAAWTDPWFHGYWAGLTNVQVDGIWIAARTPGLGYRAFVAYGYVLAMLVMVLLGRSLSRLSGVHRAQAGVMLFGVALPWVVDLLDATRIWGYIPVDLVSVSFAVTGLSFLPALVHLRFLDLTPVAWATVVKRMQEAVVVIDEAGRIAVLNPAALRLLGKSDLEILGVEAARVFESWGLLGPLLGRPAERAQETSLEVVCPASDPARHYEANLSRLSDPVRAAGWLLVLRDITEHWRVAEERAKMAAAHEARAEAEAASRAKDVFLAMLSHELRTPLTPALVSVSALIDDPTVPDSLRPTLRMISRNIGLEARLIDNLLDQTRIRRGLLSLHFECVDAHELIERALEICADDVHDGDLTLVSRLNARARHVRADATALEQVLWNLLKNAIKFSPPGRTIVVRTGNVDDPGAAGDGTRLVIEVVDEGIGIEPKLLPRVFDLFERGEPGRGRNYGGLGLGLAISRELAERHGGRLTGASEGPGRGATFTLELPTTEAPAERAAALRAEGPEPPARPLRLLLVEDNKDTLRSLSELLRGRGHAVRTAETLAGALKVVDEAGTDLDLLISDIELPDGDGLELMSVLRLKTELPGIALSGFGTRDDIDRSLAVGFAEHLTKPVEFRVLDQCIRRVAGSA